MKSDYFIEDDTYKGRKFEFTVNYQTAGPNRITAKAHLQDSIEFIYVGKGSYTAYINQHTYNIEAGDLLLILSRDVHSLRSKSSPKNGYYVIKLDPMTAFIPTAHKPYKYVIPFKLNKENRKCLWKRNELIGKNAFKTVKSITELLGSDKSTAELEIKIKCMELMMFALDEWDTSSGADEGYISDISMSVLHAVEYIYNNYMNDITAMECAKKENLSYSYFSRQFLKTTGKSFKAFLNDIRCKHAEKQLLTTDKQISEISSECGYNDTCYFISVFKTTRGMTPSQYRKEFLNQSI